MATGSEQQFAELECFAGSEVSGRVRKGATPVTAPACFRLVRSRVDIAAILEELAENTELFAKDRSRQQTAKSQRDTESIHLLTTRWPHHTIFLRGVPSEVSARFSRTMAWLCEFENEVRGVLGKALVVELKAHARVYRHVDSGRYYAQRDRYHLVLRSAGGSELTAGEESVVMQPGELWAFDNKQPHEAFNPSDDGRVHLIFDVYPRRGASLFPRARATAGSSAGSGYAAAEMRAMGVSEGSRGALTTLEQLRWIARFYRPHMGLCLAAIGVALVSSGALLPIPLLIRAIVDGALPTRNAGQVAWLVSGIVLLHIVGCGAVFLETNVATLIAKRIRVSIQTTLYDHMQQMPLAFFASNHTGRVLTHILIDVGSLSPLMPTAALAVVKGAFTTISVVAVLAQLSPRLTLIIIAVAPALLFVQNILRRQIFRASLSLKRSQERVATLLQEDLKGSILTQSFGTEEFRRRYATKAIAQAENASRRVLIKMAYATAAGVILTVAYNLVLWGYGGYTVIASSTTIGTLVAFAAYIGRIDGPVRTIVASNVGVANALASVQRLSAMLAARSPIRSLPDSKPLVIRRGEIVFRDVAFSYDAGRPLFRGLNLALPGGQVSVIIGKTGVGKTSLSQLIPRLYDVTSGTVAIDGQDIRGVDLASLRKNIAVVHQETFLFNSTIRDNLLMGRTGVSEASLVEICESVDIHKYIMSLPDQYNSEITEGGRNLSGGQKQKLAIARALLSQAPIVLLDEFTSALDSDTEKSFHPRLRKLFGGRTVVIITHNPSTIDLATAAFRLFRRDGAVAAEPITLKEAHDFVRSESFAGAEGGRVTWMESRSDRSEG